MNQLRNSLLRNCSAVLKRSTMVSRRWAVAPGKIAPLALRSFSSSAVCKLNPLVPFDALESVTDDEDGKEDKKSTKQGGGSDKDIKAKLKAERWERFRSFFFKCLETAGITFASVAILALAGITYHEAYEAHVLGKMEKAFDEGDTSFDLAIHETANESKKNRWIDRPEQALLDDIVSGKIKGRYFLLIGEKGTGKASLVLESFSKVNGFNCTTVDAHADPEIFRLRLGKALNFEFFEDYIGSLFSIRGPRDTTAILDIERAFGKLEEVAIRRVKRNKKPLVLFINSAHLIRNDAEGVNLVELLQQKAEELGGAGLVTMILSSDDYWLYERMKKLSTKLEVISITDLDRKQAVSALKSARYKYFKEELDDRVAGRIYDLIGGRPQHLSQVAKNRNMIVACHEIIDREKTWFLNQCGLLGAGMDDDVMESGKFSTSAMLLAKQLVDMDLEQLRENEADSAPPASDHKLPSLPLWRARQVMTRPDYIQDYDNLNIFTIDCRSQVKADSVPMMRAFHEICSMPGFRELLDETMDRVAAIESLGRTRELVAKDLALGGHYKFRSDAAPSRHSDTASKHRDSHVTRVTLHGGTREDDDDDDGDGSELPIPLQSLSKGADNMYWEKRMKSDYATTFVSSDSMQGDKELHANLSREGDVEGEDAGDGDNE